MNPDCLKYIFKIVNMVVDLRTPHTIFENYDRAINFEGNAHACYTHHIRTHFYCIQKIHVKVRLLR